MISQNAESRAKSCLEKGNIDNLIMIATSQTPDQEKRGVVNQEVIIDGDMLENLETVFQASNSIKEKIIEIAKNDPEISPEDTNEIMAKIMEIERTPYNLDGEMEEEND